jgi:hypothetical protein
MTANIPLTIHLISGLHIAKNGCWEWTGSLDTGGYGRLKKKGTHRLSYEIFVGPIGNFHVLHRCDNPPCCNPNHLFLGTQADNMMDKSAKGRVRVGIGEKHGKAKMTEDGVREARKSWANGESIKSIARRYDVSACSISHIVNRKLWRHVLD